METSQIIFAITAAIILVSAVLVVTVKNLVHAALWLVVTLFGVAIAFVLLSAGFLAVAQVVIYIGAIAILMIFAVMLTRRLMKDIGPQTIENWWLGALFSLIIFGGLAWLLTTWSGASQLAPEIDSARDTIVELGEALVSPNQFVIPFEVASVLLLGALIGAIYIAWDRN